MVTVHNLVSRDYMGLPDHDTADALNRVVREYDIRVRTYLVHGPSASFKESSIQWGASLPIYIVIYGREDDSEAVGQTFSELNVFLQHPHDRKYLSSYKNPQYLVRPGEEYSIVE